MTTQTWNNIGLINGTPYVLPQVLNVTVSADPVTVEKGTILAYDATADKFILYVQGDAGDAGVAVAVLAHDVTYDATGDKTVGVIRRVEGTLTKNNVIIAADGDDSNIGNVEINALNSNGILLQKVTDSGVV